MSNSKVLHHVDEQALSDLIRRHESFTLTKVKNFTKR